MQNTNEIGASRFGFQPTSIACVEKLLKEVKTKKSPGHDNIQPRLLRESATVIAAPLTSLINHSIDQSKYPSVWKKGQITPLLKSNGDDMYKNFYRPVSVLPSLNNVYERLLASQLLAHFKQILSDFVGVQEKL